MSLASLSPVGHQVEVLKLCMGESLVGFNVMIKDKCLSKWQPHGQGRQQVPNGIVPGKSEHRVTLVLMTDKKNVWELAHPSE